MRALARGGGLDLLWERGVGKTCSGRGGAGARPALADGLGKTCSGREAVNKTCSGSGVGFKENNYNQNKIFTQKKSQKIKFQSYV